jgi:hypothetical protein
VPGGLVDGAGLDVTDGGADCVVDGVALGVPDDEGGLADCDGFGLDG